MVKRIIAAKIGEFANVVEKEIIWSNLITIFK